MSRKIQSLQCVWFTPSPSMDALSLFQQAMGTEPSASQSQKLPSGHNVTIAQGEFEESAVTLQVQPGRIDCFLMPLGFSASPVPIFLPPTFDDFDLAFGRVDRLIRRMPDFQPIRLALVCNLLELANSTVEASEKVRATSGLELPLTGMEEFFLRINKRRPCKAVEGLSINRLMNWRVDTVQLVALAQGGVASSPHANHFGAGLSVDINTAEQPSPPFTQPQVLAIFSEIAAEARRLSLAGSAVALAD